MMKPESYRHTGSWSRHDHGAGDDVHHERGRGRGPELRRHVAPQVSRDENWQAALAAAQAGVDDYLAKLNRTDAYAQSPWIAATSPSRGRRPRRTRAGGTAGPLPAGSMSRPGTRSAGKFHYDVNTANFWKDGSVWVESTGKVRGVSRARSRSVWRAAVRPTSCTTPTSRTRIRRTWSRIHPGDPSRWPPVARSTTCAARAVPRWHLLVAGRHSCQQRLLPGDPVRGQRRSRRRRALQRLAR